jgi:hypothetical protein
VVSELAPERAPPAVVQGPEREPQAPEQEQEPVSEQEPVPVQEPERELPEPEPEPGVPGQEPLALEREPLAPAAGWARPCCDQDRGVLRPLAGC